MRAWLWTFLIGFAAGVAATTQYAWPLMFLVLMPFFCLAAAQPDARKAAVVGLSFGFGYGLIIFSWTFSWLGLLLTTSLPIPLALAMSAYSWFLTVGTPAIGYALFAVCMQRMWSGKRIRHRDLVALGIAFVLCEVFGVFLFHLVFWGAGSSLAPHFAFGMMGYALGESAIPLQYAWLGGVFALSFVLAYANLLVLAWSLQRRASFGIVFALIALAPFAIFAVRTQERVSRTMTVGVVHTEFDSNFEWTEDGFRAHHALLRDDVAQLAAESPDLLVLPESSDFFMRETRYFGTSSPILTRLHEQRIVVADSGSVGEIGASASRIYYRGAPGEPYADKHVLLPQGEYVPYIQRALQGVVASPDSFRALQNVLTYEPGALDSNVQIPQGVVATRFCSESMSPFLYAYNTYRGAELLVNVASHSWFVGSDLLSFRTEEFGRVRAVETGRWFVQSGNKTSSFVVDHLGRVVSRVRSTPQVVRVELRDERTPYEQLVGVLSHVVRI
jgi:apolipoprotein N-acyltransferase